MNNKLVYMFHSIDFDNLRVNEGLARTNGNGIADGDEIALGLDPNNAATNGIACLGKR